MRVYLLAPANVATGGTELLHQYSRCLTDLGIENYMVYPNRDEVKCPTPETFLKYRVKYVTRYVDAEDSVLVLAETQIHLVKECVRGTAMIWWLSVDNYLEAFADRFVGDELDIFELRQRKNVVHFVQSYYAKDFVENKLGLGESFFLKDYINDQIVQIADELNEVLERRNICLYNPKKGLEAIEPIIEATQDEIQWIPLIGLKPDEMAKMMCLAKVYVDFGKHPGKDRIPREAAVCGCLVLTNKKGSAAYQEDVNIPVDCKTENTDDVVGIIEKIKDLMTNYQDRYGDYETYRKQIRGEKAEFLKEAKKSVEILQKTVELKMSQKIQLMDYAQPLTSVRKALQAMDNMAADSINACYGGNEELLKNYLLDMDYMLQLVRETIYLELSDLSQQ